MKTRMWGDGLTPYHLLIHGTASSGRIWLKMLEGADRQRPSADPGPDRRCDHDQSRSVSPRTFIVPDLPGMGESELLPDLTFDRWVEETAASVEEFLKATQRDACTAKVHIVGHSLGAAVAMHLAPLEWVESAALICPVTSAFCRRMREPHAQGGRPGSIRLRRVEGSLAYDPLALTREDAAMLRDDYHKASGLLESGLPWPGFEASEARLLAGKRTLVVWGEKDDVVDPAYARELVDELRAAQVDVTAVSIPGCGHVPMLERPSELLRILHEFWGGRGQ